MRASPQAPLSSERDTRICALFRDGRTILQIGDEFGLSKQRVQQILSKAGVRRGHGGRCILVRRRNTAKGIARDARTVATYGCDRATLIEVNGGPPSRAGCLAAQYVRQKCGAGYRGIEWRMTFPEWVKVWVESGHLAERGCRANAYVMARHGDVGPYAVGNIYFTTMAGNASDYQAWRNGKRPRPLCAVVA